MANKTERPTRVFLSSPFQSRDDVRTSITEFRKQLQTEAPQLGFEIELAEDHTKDKNASESDSNLIDVISICNKRLAVCDVVVALIFERHGSPITFKPADAVEIKCEVSIFETEMLVAAMLAKPTLLIYVHGFTPHDKLAAFLKLIETAQLQRTSCRQTEILNSISGWLAAGTPGQRSKSTDIFDLLLRKRQAGRRTEANRPELLFLGGVEHLSSSGTTNLALVETAIKSARQSVDGQGRHVPETVRLAFLWAAFRELFKENNPELLRQRQAIWQDALGAWASLAAWAGMKGPFLLGELAAVNANFKLMEAVGCDPSHLPYGARASALLGIARYSRARRVRLDLLRLAQALCTEHIRFNSADPSGGYLIRGYVNGHLAIHGQPWMAWNVLSDFQKALSVREKSPVRSDTAIGEAMADLGFAQSSIVPSWGLSRLKEGVALMEKDTHHRRNFILRGKDNYANALRKAGRLDEADSQAAEAAKLRGEDKTDQ